MIGSLNDRDPDRCLRYQVLQEHTLAVLLGQEVVVGHMVPEGDCAGDPAVNPHRRS